MGKWKEEIIELIHGAFNFSGGAASVSWGNVLHLPNPSDIFSLVSKYLPIKMVKVVGLLQMLEVP